MSDTTLETIYKKDKELVYDKQFLNKVYKRTENVCNASFYLSQNITDTATHSSTFIQDKILKTTDEVLSSLSHILTCDKINMRHTVVQLTAHLHSLSTILTIGATAELIPTSHATLIKYEIDALISEIDEVKKRQVDTPSMRYSIRARRSVDSSPYSNHTATMNKMPGDVSTGNDTIGEGDIPDRKQRIKEILRDKGQVGIKDIADVIKDVGEKSIQRDLNDLIVSGEVVRIGERRWSTYRLL